MDTVTEELPQDHSGRKRRLPRNAYWGVLPAVLLAVVAVGYRTVEAAGPGLDVQDGLQIFTRDVFWIQGVTLRNPTEGTPPDAPLFNVAGVALPVTWAQWQAATAESTVITTGGHASKTLALIRLSGLIPNGVYSMFYGTLEPDSENPGCPGVERTLPLTSIAPHVQRPDASSFVADASGNAFYVGRVDGDLLASYQVFFSVVYHFDGGTYDPYPNKGEFLTHDRDDTPCRSSFGEDAMRQLLILQKQ
jgi:hypothetical protein